MFADMGPKTSGLMAERLKPMFTDMGPKTSGLMVSWFIRLMVYRFNGLLVSWFHGLMRP